MFVRTLRMEKHRERLIETHHRRKQGGDPMNPTLEKTRRVGRNRQGTRCPSKQFRTFEMGGGVFKREEDYGGGSR